MTTVDLVVMDYRASNLVVDDPEEVLIERLSKGDLSAISDVYDRYHRQVRGFARRLVGEDEATEDLVQEVFVSLPSAIRRFRGESSLKTFILSIAVNHSRHHVRGAIRRRKAMQKLAETIHHEGISEPSGNPEELARRKQLAQLLQRGLDELPLEQRVAFVLCEVEERSSSDVARIVDVPEATVRTRLFHARKKLRSFLELQGVVS
jgi:RNA polymerase sigma-70 factor (ECF subfamily)